MTRYILAIAAILILAACKTSNHKSDLSFTEKPNIVLIAVDDLNNWVGAWGGQAKTPHIDKLASQGRMFSQAYCVAPACNPSRVALFTGLRPENTGQFVNDGNFRDLPGGNALVTLPQRLSQAGYKTAGAGKLFHSPRGGAAEPNVRSDDISWDFQWKGNVGTPGHHLFLNDKGYANWLEGSESAFINPEGYVNSGMSYISRFGVWGAIPHAKKECGDWKVADYGVNFLQEEHDKPFFLGIGIFRPHSPQIVPQEFIDMYPLDEIQLHELPDDDMNDIPAYAQTNWSSPFVELVHEKGQLAQAVQGYLASCSFADACIGHFLNALDKSKYRDNTIIVLFSDHGFQLGHKDRWEKFSLWKQGTNMPMIIRMPNNMIEPGQTSEAVSLLDIYPTIMDILNLEPPVELDGESLVTLLIDKNFKREIPAIVTWEQGSHSILRNNWNYIHYKDGSEELYNQKDDPNEYVNLAKKPEYRNLMDQLKGFIPFDNFCK